MRYAILVLFVLFPIVAEAQKNVDKERDDEFATGFKITKSGSKGPLKYNYSGVKGPKNYPFTGKIGPRVDLSNAELSGSNLRWVSLTRANLTNANLVGCNLEGADLTQANLQGAILSGANLSNADLSGVNISGAILKDINYRADNREKIELVRVNLAKKTHSLSKTGRSPTREYL